MKNKTEIFATILFVLLNLVNGSDITKSVFGDVNSQGMIPAAFGDFNSDEFTDVFMIKNDERTVEIYTGYDKEPLLRQGPMCEYKNIKINSVVPGDFDGDALMDIMITSKNRNDKYDVFINWGTVESNLICANESNPLIENMIGQPVALDYNRDMIIDLFGLDINNKRTFYKFHNDRSKPEPIFMGPITAGQDPDHLKYPHSHAYLDLNNDFMADLFLVTEKGYELWKGVKKENVSFVYDTGFKFPKGEIIGQTLFLDFELKGHLIQIVPVCIDSECNQSTLFARIDTQWYDIEVSFKEGNDNMWGFVKPKSSELYANTITLRGGDFNMDGYPDLLVTLTRKYSGSNHKIQTFLMENIPTSTNSPLTRTFVVRWNALQPFTNGSVLGAFYDFFQDGILDVLMVEKQNEKIFKTVAFRNTLDYDANFVKVIVLTGLKNQNSTEIRTPLGRRKRTYGTNLPGPRIEYSTTTQEGLPQHGASAQLPQSAYFSLQLPYTIFGLGRTPNFVDSLNVGLSNHSRQWTQLIPNSQMIVIPWPTEEPSRWKAQLFVTPSKLIWMSVFALGVTCLVIMFIILGLYIKEKREDKLEKLAEAHRFHFDAM